MRCVRVCGAVAGVFQRLVIASLFTISVPVHALPTGGQVGAGSGTIDHAGATVTINQASRNLSINWQDFSIAAAEAVRFNQPDAASVALNRVIGQDPSRIFGTLSANGQVFILNPNGVLFGKSARVNVGGLLASTLGLDEANSRNGSYAFVNGGDAAAVINQGTLTAAEGGYIALLAPQLRNEGVVTARLGTAVLAAADAVSVNVDNGSLVGYTLGRGALDALIENRQLIQAAGGQVIMSAKALDAAARASINNSGVVEARGFSVRAGRILITADAGHVTNTGTLDASNDHGAGGSMAIRGHFVALGGEVRADGVSGGDVRVDSGSTLSLADHVSARGSGGAGGLIDYRAAGRVLENAGSVSDVSGAAGGSVLLHAEGGLLSSGTYLAQGLNGRGGRIDLSGDSVRLLSASLDVSGSAEGGLVRIGGAFQGGKPGSAANADYVARFGELPGIASSRKTFINDTTRIDLSSSHGRGGGAIVWSDVETTMLGRIDAAGATSGGAVEFSSADLLRRADLLGVNGAASILLDPKNITIGDVASISNWSYQAIVGAGYARSSDVTLAVGDYFGGSLALNAAGDRLAVGAYFDDGAAGTTANAGAVYLFGFTDANFSGGSLQATLGKGYSGGKNVDVTALEANDIFGAAVAFNAVGDRLAVGAPWDDGAGNLASDAGAVYLFSFTDANFSGGSLQATLGKGYGGGKNVDVAGLDAFDYFGAAVSFNAAGDRVAVGAKYDDGNGNVAPDAGAVYLFGFTDASFAGGSLLATLGKGYGGGNNVDVTALEAGDVFGAAVALNAAGDRLAVGAYGDDGSANSIGGSGAVYLYTFADGSFATGSLQGVIGKGYSGGKNVNLAALEANDVFGISVALDAVGDRLAVGAYGDDGSGNLVSGSGAVHLLGFADGSFTGGSLLGTIGKGYSGGKNVDVVALETNDLFGAAVALNAAGDRLAVGALWDDGDGNIVSDSGAVYLFSFTDAGFSSGNLQGIMGAGYDDGNNVDLATLAAADLFGSAVALNAAADRLAVGAYGDDGADNLNGNAGAVYLFSFSDSNFSGGTLQATLGKGYGGGKNIDVAVLEAGDHFGYAVSLNAAGDRLAVGANSDDGSGNLVSGSGAVYLFNFSDGNFNGGSLQATLGRGYAGGSNVDLPVLEASDRFGTSVSLNAVGDRLAVGAKYDDGNGNLVVDSGAAYLFSFTDGNFSGGSLQATLGKGYGGGKNVDVAALETLDYFGAAVALNAGGDRLAVGAHGDDGAGAPVIDAGAVHLFSFTDGNFSGGSLQATLGKGYGGGNNVDVTTLASGDIFGAAISFNADGDRLAVGAPGDDGLDAGGDPVVDSGAAYLFNFTGTSFSTGALQGVLGKGYTGHVAALDAGDMFGMAVSLNGLGDRLAVGAANDGGAGNLIAASGAVYLFGAATETGLSYADYAGQDVTVSAAEVARTLSKGIDLTLQANNDITVGSAVTATASGNGGMLTLQAGRNISINANITTDNGALLAIAGDAGADTAYLDAGTPTLTLGSGVTLDAGTAAVTLVAKNGTFINNAGASAFNAASWQVWSSDPAVDTRGGLVYDFKQYNAVYGTTAVAGTGKGVLYSRAATITPALVLAPTLTSGLGSPVSKVYDGNNIATLSVDNYSFSGVLDGDSLTFTRPLTGTYDNKNAGTSKSITVTGLGITSATNGAATVYGYTLAPSVSASIGSIERKPLTISGTAVTSKIYDGTTTATVTPGTPAGFVGSETVTVTGAAGTFDTKDAGTGKAVTVTYTLTDGTNGGLANNYSLANTVTGEITRKALTVTTNDATRQQGTMNPAFSVSYDGFISGEDADDLGGALVFTTPATVLSPGGSYPVTSSGLTSDNYVITYLNGRLAVTAVPGPVDVARHAIHLPLAFGEALSGTPPDGARVVQPDMANQFMQIIDDGVRMPYPAQN